MDSRYIWFAIFLLSFGYVGFYYYLQFSLELIAKSSHTFRVVGDLNDWREVECQPEYQTKGSETDCEKSIYLWKKIHVKNGTDYCDTETVVKQVELICTESKAYNDWPLSEYGQEFLNNNRTHQCWTNCNRYMNSTPPQKLQQAENNLFRGFEFLLLLPLFQILVFPFPSIREKVTLVFYVYFTKGNYVPPLYKLKDTFYALQSIALSLYFPYWVSIVNCARSTSNTCPLIRAGYYVEKFLPLLLLLFGCWKRLNSFTCCNIKFNSIFCLLFASFTFIKIAMITELKDDCFKPSWCDKQVEFISVWYGFVFMGFLAYYAHPIWKKYKEEYKPLILENQRKKDVLQIVERKWQGQKDIIFPLIDEREHIWNEIWTMCWGMEQIFWDPETRNEKYCDLLLSGYEGEESPSEFHVFISYKFCYVSMVNDYLALLDYTTSETISFKSVAQTKGNINWQSYQSEKSLVEDCKTFLCKRLISDMICKKNPSYKHVRSSADLDTLMIDVKPDNEIPSVRNGRAMELQPTFEEKMTLYRYFKEKSRLKMHFN